MAASPDHDHHDSENLSIQPDKHDRPKRGGMATKAGGIAVIALAAIYSFAAPKLNDRYGWDLPAIKTDSRGNVRLDDKKASSPTAKLPAEKVATPNDDPSNRRKDDSQTRKQSDRNTSPKFTPAQQTSQQKTSPPDANESANASDSDSDLLYGILQEVSRDRYVSPQGLLYTPGSAEGHRLKHLERHTKDQPSRPGKHGVFDGGMEKALLTIDRAYERAKKKQKTTVSKEDGRTVYTVDLGGRVGYIGGRVGNQKRKPMARRVRLVLDGNRVITAFPL